MKKSMLGIDIGTGSIKLVTNDQCVVIDTPENVFENDHFIAFDGMSEIFKTAVKEHCIRNKKVSLILPDEDLYFSRTTLPLMSEKQLKVNLPYEFSKIVGKDADQYIYDYSLISRNDHEMDMFIGCIKRQQIERYQEMFRNAGMKLVSALPRQMALTKMLIERKGDIALVDLGYTHTRIDMFKDGVYETGRVLEYGVDAMVRIASEELYCDEHIALEYLKTNKNDVLHCEKMKDLYDYLSTEIMRAVNYYTYENQENTLETLYYYGGGSNVLPFIETLKNTISLRVEAVSTDADVMNALCGYGASQE